MPLWLPVLLVGLLFAVGVRAMERRAQTEGYGWVDPASLSLDALPDWADDRWAETLANLFADFPPFRTDDILSVAVLESELRGLSFVRTAEVREILWPGGLEVEFELREPVACIPVGRHFLPVSDEGIVLPGFWTRPPQVEGRFLPVIAPLEDAHGIFSGASPGDWLAEERHVDALAIVRSLRAHLDREDVARMGRFSILATDARIASGDVPGAMLLLEGDRRIWFGRPPKDSLLGLVGAPGELQAWAKWEAVARALALLETNPQEEGRASTAPSGAWQIVDVRWDRPEILLEPAQLVSLAEETRLASLPEEPPQRAYQAPPASPRAITPTPSLDRPRRTGRLGALSLQSSGAGEIRGGRVR